MKKFVFALLASILATPALAGPEEVRSWYSLDAQGCMMLRECTEDVFPVDNMSQIEEFVGVTYGEETTAEANVILEQLNTIGAPVYIADARYFPRDTRGVYDPGQNALFLNAGRVVNNYHLLQTLRHEGWHAAQDCMAGTLDNGLLAIIVPEEDVPSYWRDTARRLYPENVRPWEAEAKWAGSEPSMTADALKACAGGEMWKVYEPTPLTAKWLRQNGYL